MIYRLPLIIILLCNSNVYSQKFEAGIITINKKDSIKGLIQIKSKDQSVCIFRKNSKSPISTYQASQINSIQFDNGLKFLSLNLSGNDSTHNYELVEVLVSGKLSLIKSTAGFILIYNDEIVLLKNNKTQVVVGSTQYSKYDNQFIKQLTNYMNACPALKEDINKSRLSQKSLIPLVVKYSQCTGNEATVPGKELRKTLLSVGLLAGVGNTNVENPYSYDQDIFYPGISISFSSSDPRKRFFINTDLLYLQYKIDKTKVLNYQSNQFSYRIDFDYNSISIPISIGYRLPLSNKTSLKFESGFVMQFVNISKDIIIIEETRGGTTTIKEIEDSFNPMVPNYYPFGAFGVAKQLNSNLGIQLKLRYEVGSWISTEYVNHSTFSAQGGLFWNFSK